MFRRLKEALTSRLQSLGDVREEHAGPVAAAMLLLEVAWADHQISEAEVDRTQRALSNQFSLPDDTVRALVAQARAAHGSTISMYPFTRTVNESLSLQERKQLLVNCWRLANADNVIDMHEEYTIRRIADLLYLSHEDFIAAKLEARREN